MATPGAQLSPEALSYYAQMGIPVPQQQPNIQAYAQQPMQQAPQIPQAMQPSDQRMQYNALIEQRFNDIANMVGGVNALIETGTVDKVRQRAAQDIERIYGSFQEPPRIIEMDGNKIAVGGDFRTPVPLPTEAEKQYKELQVKQAQAQLSQSEKEARNKQFEQVKQLTASANQFNEGIRVIDQILADPRIPENVGASALFSVLPATDARAIAGMINQVKGQNFLNAYESLRGAGGIGVIEGQKAEQAMGRVDQYLKEADLRKALTDLRDRYVYAKQQSDLGLQYFQSPDQAEMGATPAGAMPQQATPTTPPPPAEPMKVQSPGTIRTIRDPQTGRLIRQQ
jgi:hypothetical protein